MSDDLIFREVDEDVRRERMEAVWKRYGGLALGGAVLIVAIVAGTVLYRDYVKSEREANGAAFEAASRLVLEEKYAEAATAFERLAADSGSGYQVLGALQAAEARAKAGAPAEALAAYDRLIASGDAPSRLRDIVRIKAALLALENDGGDAAIQRLGDLGDKEGGFRNAAREVKASALLAKGDRAGAIAELKSVAEDNAATPSQRDRALRFLQALGG